MADNLVSTFAVQIRGDDDPQRPNVTKTLDVCGLICPYPDMEALATLKKMTRGEVLEVILDYPFSLGHLRQLTKPGHKLLEIKRIAGPKHRLIIEANALN
jgi:TusA-related sulfurtransferase